MNIEIPDEDAAVVRAILLTHAEMQDRQTVENEEIRGRLKREGGDGAEAMIESLEEMHGDLIEDRDDLKRLADYFQ